MGAIGWQLVLFSLFRLLWRRLPIVLLLLAITDSTTAISYGSIPLVEESNSTLLSDNSTDPNNGTVESSPPVQMKFQSSRGEQISKDSWAKYMDFTESTCRTSYLAPNAYKDPQYDYWNWEQSEFNRQLRKMLLVEAKSNHADLDVLSMLEGSLLASAPFESYCNRSIVPSNNESPHSDHDRLYDTLFDIIFPSVKKDHPSTVEPFTQSTTDEDFEQTVILNISI